ncbi:MAG: TlpA family protein disulfide reductase [Gemmatimonas sp.]|jgi:thiol-disulfide isomerase/thioredoxin|uniref:TlpA family protein disulfide reductase n=1 Tax=Gemmatimonas sp. TaxID=1962908 RepID=UPI0033402B7D|nr:thioredoxin family protein [Gemmatimonadota bacterium]
MNRILTAFAAVALTCVYSTEAQTQNTAADTAYTPSQDFQSGRQVIAVYFGASWCKPCDRPDMKEAVRRMKPMLLAQAVKHGAFFSAMGVALDRDLAKALTFLTPNGAFDEYVIGSDLTSLAAERFIWGDPDNIPAVPQVVVLERNLKVERGKPITFGATRVVRRIRGDSIPPWVKAGATVSFDPKW